ncbi:hypothetical protein AYI68_g1234 [Smittium mucronatum]|uniref:Uncharacterized protein n=1 Tax=Smittium mucronatum TaxID=133383 RepID=A0A1R0H682_9FUNG|nr:hypothetical protein AYI68_g1234 [Smittium mucronatum]
MIKNICKLLLISAVTIISSVKSNKNQDHVFKFYSKSYYNGFFKKISPEPKRCYEVGPFLSAQFGGPRVGAVKMCSGSDCSGKCVIRDMKTAYAPGDNIKDYGRFFSSIIYNPNKATHKFSFYFNSYYKGLIKEIHPISRKCYKIGPFLSAQFGGPRVGAVKMCSGSDCSGECVIRDMKTAYAPGDNIKDYGRFFSSIIYNPNKASHKFSFYSSSYYKGHIKSVDPKLNRCYNIGPFSSAKFDGPKIGSVEMCSELDCGGICATRDMKTGNAPGDNNKDYGFLFKSIMYRKESGCTI